MKNSFNTAKNEYRWRLVKRKKQVVNFCMALSFVMSFAVPGYSFADPATDATPVKTGDIVGSTTEVLDLGVPTNPVLNIQMNNSYTKASYSTYNIGSDATVNVSGGDVYVAKIDGSNGASEIFGHLNASGVAVFLMNTAGITFGAGSQVNVGSLVATTAADVDESTPDVYDFGSLSNASVINNGDITVNDGGWAILAAPYVENNGTITVGYDAANSVGGHIELASTQDLKIDMSGGGLITYSAPGSVVAGATQVGVTNTGTLSAKSGTINISAHVASDIVQSVVNLDGVVDADSFDTASNGGTIVVSSDAVDNSNPSPSTVRVASTAVISAKGGSVSGDGGTVTVTADDVNFGGSVDASATDGVNGTLVINSYMINVRDSFSYGSSDAFEVASSAIENASNNGTNVELNAVDDVNLVSGLILKNGDLKVTGYSINSGAIWGDVNGDGVNVNMQTTGGGIEIGTVLLESGGSLTLHDSGAGDVFGYGGLTVNKTSTTDNLNGSITLAADGGSIDVIGVVAVDQSSTTDYNNIVNSSVNITAANDVSLGYLYVNATSDAGNAGAGDASATSFVNIQSSGGDVNLGSPVVVYSNAMSRNAVDPVISNNVTTSNNTLTINAANDINIDGYISISNSAVSQGSSGTAGRTVYSDVSATESVSLTAGGAVNVTDSSGSGGIGITNYASNWAEQGATAISQSGLAITADSLTIGNNGIYSASSAYLDSGYIAVGNPSATATSDVNIATNNAVSVGGEISVNSSVTSYATISLLDSESKSNLAIDSANSTVDISGPVYVYSYLDQVGGNSAKVNALANITAKGDVILGSGSEISAELHSYKGTYAPSIAYLDIESTDGSVTVDGDINVAANRGLYAPSGTAIAGYDLVSSGSGTSAVYGNSATVKILAGQDVSVNGSVSTDAHSQIYSSGGVSDAGSSANIDIEAGLGDVNIGGNLESTAFSSNVGSTGYADSVSNITLSGLDSVDVTGDILSSSELFSFGSAPVRVESNVDVSSDGNITLGGDITLHSSLGSASSAADIGAGASEVKSAFFLTSGGGNVQVDGNVLMTADANVVASGGGNVYKTSLFVVHADDDINFAGDIDLTTTSNHSGAAISEVASIASVQSDAGSITVDGDVNVATSANDDVGSAYTLSSAVADFTANQDLTVNGEIAISIDSQSIGDNFTSGNLDSILWTDSGDIHLVGGLATSINNEVTSGSAFVWSGLDLTINSGKDVIIDGPLNISSNSIAASGSNSSSAELSIDAVNNINLSAGISSNTSADITSGSGYSFLSNQVSVDAGNDVTITGNVILASVLNSGTSGSAYTGFESSAGNDVNVVGDIDVSTISTGSSAIAAISSSEIYANTAPTGSIDITGNISAESTSNGNAESYLILEASNNLFIQGNDPLVVANANVLQQQTSGIASDATGIAQLTLTGASVRFFDAAGFDAAGFDRAGFDVNGYDVNGYDINGFNANGFNSAGINQITGTLYDPNGYDVNGFDINGFNIAGIHKDTGTIYNLAGFDMFGNLNPALLASRNGIITVLTSGNLGSDTPSLEGTGSSIIQNIAPASGSDDCDFMNCGDGENGGNA